MTATGEVNSIRIATPTSMRSTALKYASWQPATAMTPYATSSPAFWRSRPQRPRNEIAAGTTRTAAAMRTRAVTAEPAVHPDSISALANGPDSANDIADSTRERQTRRAGATPESTAMSWVNGVMAHDTTRIRM